MSGQVSKNITEILSGRIYGSRILGGPPSLEQAAEVAMSQYVYRPFEENGHPVNVATTVDVVFKLGDGARAVAAYPVQKISLDRSVDGQHFGDFISARDADSVDTLSPKLKLWLRSGAAA